MRVDNKGRELISFSVLYIGEEISLFFRGFKVLPHQISLILLIARWLSIKVNSLIFDNAYNENLAFFQASLSPFFNHSDTKYRYSKSFICARNITIFSSHKSPLIIRFHLIVGVFQYHIYNNSTACYTEPFDSFTTNFSLKPPASAFSSPRIPP